ncbi:hypothetical protein AMATHDRAFT_72877 [Amanita thiersii Skay4041]|uniref:Man1/Src1 C-terminal domain-containing protein n=1 Tax=Amanita thiersii Skay4041 TaxID=703135 RepID=A0A2A9NV29_9AGAR|nr:hypothetical protein AMATHDRAFT_72877 [Amanita thiersii Skay4041]
MSRLTTSQIISLGEYLEPDFDPTSLTVSQLLGVLGYHNVKYPTPYSKPKLVQLFNDEIKTRSAKLKKERLKRQNSMASDDGIKDGVTGKPLAATRRVLPVRRSSRRQSHAPAEEPDHSPVRQESPKRRRSSAQPALAGTSRKPVVQPTLFEDSESDEIPVRKVTKSKKSGAASAESRRVSQTLAEDSGWEDNNIFQSGAEDSSPVRPSPSTKVKIARKVPRKSRKSTSAPPQFLLPVSPVKDTDSIANVRPPQSKFEPELSVLSSPNTRFPTGSPRPKELSPVIRQTPIKAEKVQPELGSDKEALDTLVQVLPDQEGMPDRLDSVHEREAQVPVLKESNVMGRDDLSANPRSSIISRFLWTIFLISLGTLIVNHKLESASIGYCDQGTNTNTFLNTLRARRLAIESCNRENRTLLYSLVPTQNDETNDGVEYNDSEPCPLMPLLPFLQPDRCTPCPEHAACEQYGVKCDTGYILQSHLFLSFLPPLASTSNISLSASATPLEVTWKLVSLGLDGLPGLGSIALPPRCVEDPRRKRNIGALGKAVEALLGQERGLRLCTRGQVLQENIKDIDGGEAKRWGLELGQLRETMRKKTSPHLLPAFDDTFNEAIQQLVQWGGVIVGEDQEGKRYVAHGTPDLTWACTLIVKSRNTWLRWRTTVFGMLFMIFLTLIGRARRTQRHAENKRVAELVQIALDSLRNQELAHHTDPITAPHPYLSSLQLRDLILQDEHTIPVRKRLWDQVERVVEENANVRVNMEEVPGGDEMRVWRWIGSAGRTKQHMQA